MFIQKKNPTIVWNPKYFFGHFHALKKNKLLNKDPKLTNFRYGKKISDSPKTKFCLEIRG